MRIYPIRTKRLLLRLPEMRDDAALVELMSEPSIHRNIPRIPFPVTQAYARKWLRRVRRPRFDESFGRGYVFIVEMDGEVVGSCHFSWNVKQGRAFFGYWIGKPYRGQGLATELSKGLLDFAFG